MLNKNNKRMLAYTEKVTKITSIENADRLEAVHINGWTCVCGKGEFKEGDLGVFFEIDSKLPDKKPFNDIEFLISKHFKIKTQKIRGTISQGLFLPLSFFEGYINIPKEIHEDLTETLGVTYSVAEDNKRKASIDKYSKMKQRHAELFKTNKFVQWLYKRDWGKKVLFLFLGKKSDKRGSGWLDWVKKTDEERAQNLAHIFPMPGVRWIVTEKIDGSSTTFTIKRDKKGKNKFHFYVCSRNVCFDKPEKEDKLFYDTNIYTEMAGKYNIEAILKEIIAADSGLDFVTLQGETYGKDVQKKTYGIEGHEFKAFNLIYGKYGENPKRLNPIEMTKELSKYEIPCVPVLDENFELPSTVDEMIAYADGKSVIDGSTREGVVLRTVDGENSFKAVSNTYLIEKGE